MASSKALRELFERSYKLDDYDSGLLAAHLINSRVAREEFRQGIMDEVSMPGWAALCRWMEQEIANEDALHEDEHATSGE